MSQELTPRDQLEQAIARYVEEDEVSDENEMVSDWYLVMSTVTMDDKQEDLYSYRTVKRTNQPWHTSLGLVMSAVDDLRGFNQ